MVGEEDCQQNKNKMCSNNNSGGRSSGSGGGGGCMCAKKAKVKKVPQRGPGVAELEKILREQKKEEERPVGEGLSSASSLPRRFNPHSSSVLFSPPSMPPPPTPLTLPSRNIQLMSKPDPICPSPFPPSTHFGDSQMGAAGSGSFPSGSPGNGYFSSMLRRSCDGEGPKLDSGFQFSSRFTGEPSSIQPTAHPLQRKCDQFSARLSGEPSSNQPPPHPLQRKCDHFSGRLSGEPSSVQPLPHPLQRKYEQYPHAMMNLYSSSSTQSSSTPSLCGVDHNLEHPSSQRSYLWPDEEKIISMKRSLPFSVDYPATPFVRYNVPPFSHEMNRPDKALSSSNIRVFNSEPKNIFFRESNQSGPSEPGPKKCKANYKPLDGNILQLGPPKTTPSTPTSNEEFFELHKGSMDDSYQRSGPGGSSNQTPFYSFLQLKGHTGSGESTSNLDNGKSESESDSIDLNLKL